jgi:hypothetical protein
MMKFLIQKCFNEVKDDFAFTLLKAIDYTNWYRNNKDIKYKFINTEYYSGKFTKLEFKPFHKDYVPIGSVEFVSEFIKHFYDYPVKPINIPEELLDNKYTKRFVFNGTEKEVVGEKFVKSNDKIKGFCQIVTDDTDIPEGNYQISEPIDIDSEWRAFVYDGKLVGLQNYAGDFTLSPHIPTLMDMIARYEKDENAPIAYTLDVGVKVSDTYVNQMGITFVIEVHDFFSCGLYGFSDLLILPNMFHRWFREYLFINF